MAEPDRDDSPSKPVPARALGSPAPKAPRPGGRRQGREARDGRGGGLKSTPLRDTQDAQGVTVPMVGSDVDEVSFEGDGAAWIARLMGRSGGAGSPPLLLLGFRRAGADAAEREVFVVGAALSALTEDQLAEALARAGGARAADAEPRPFFPDAGDARSR